MKILKQAESHDNAANEWYMNRKKELQSKLLLPSMSSNGSFMDYEYDEHLEIENIENLGRIVCKIRKIENIENLGIRIRE